MRMTTPLTGEQYREQAAITPLPSLPWALPPRTVRRQPRPRHYLRCRRLPPHSAGQLLAPWPNRVAHGSYAFEDATYQLAISDPKLDNAIHGLTRFAIFDLVGRTEASVTLRSQGHGSQGYPFAVQVDATYSLDAEVA